MFLNICELNHENRHFAAVTADKTRKFFHFLARSFRCVRRAFEMHRAYLHSAPRHHISRNGAVKPARKHEKPVAAYAARKPSRTPLCVGVNENMMLTNLRVNRNFRLFHFYFQMRKNRKQFSAELRAYFGRFFRIRFVRSFRHDFERLCKHQRGTQIFRRLRKHCVKVVVADRCARDADRAENAAKSVFRFVHIDVFVFKIDEYGRLLCKNMCFAQCFDRIADIAEKQVFEFVSVGAFKHHFALFEKNNFFHLSSFILRARRAGCLPQGIRHGRSLRPTQVSCPAIPRRRVLPV